MKGVLKFAKYPEGKYRCVIGDVRSGIDTKKNDVIVIHYEVLDGPRAGETFKETLRFVSEKFLEALDQPHNINDEWDTEYWIGCKLIVDVAYTKDEAKWPRYGHYKEPVEPDTESEEKIPF